MMDTLIKKLRDSFNKIVDSRATNKSYTLSDLLMTAFAMFSLKDPSLLFFRKNYAERSANLSRIYGIDKIPSDTTLRDTLDLIKPKVLHKEFKSFIHELRVQGVLEKRKVLGKYLAIAGDGTQPFCSCQVSCPNCLVKEHRNGTKTYYHQFLAAALVHPDEKTVFPTAAEAIVRQDGNTKNDCELNAGKRLVPKIREALPDEKLITLWDALYANGPFIRLLGSCHMSFIISVKNNFVTLQAQRLREAGKLEELTWEKEGRMCIVQFTNKLILNGSHTDIEVNYLRYTEIDTETGEVIYQHEWITDIPLNRTCIKEVVRVARCRWKIENETFNTLKNQGYHFTHNYGHGEQYLATNFAILTILAFLIDQIAQEADQAFQKALVYCGSKKVLWYKVKQIFDLLPVISMNTIYRIIYKDITFDLPVIGQDSS